MMQKFLLPLVGLGLLAIVVAAALFLGPDLFGPRPLRGTEYPNPQPAPDFTLTTTGGEKVSLRDFAGKVILIYFGYTFCPDICPTTMADLARVQAEVDPDGSDVQVVMITVDPARDTPQVAGDYAASFHPTFIGMSGTPEEIAAVAEDYGVFYQAQEGTSATGYLVDHTARVFVVDKAGDLRVAYAFGTDRDDIVSDLRALLR